MQRLAMDLRVLSRELSLYLEHQVQVGFFGSGVGLSLILGFSVAYACYYLSSIAKVSRGGWGERGRRGAGPLAALLRVTASGVAGGLPLAGAGGWGHPGGKHSAPELLPFPGHLMDGLGARAGKPPTPTARLPVGPARVRGPQTVPSDLRARGAGLSPFATPAEMVGCSTFENNLRISTFAFPLINLLKKSVVTELFASGFQKEM